MPLHALSNVLAFPDVEPRVTVLRFAPHQIDAGSFEFRPCARHQFLDAVHWHDHRLPGPVDEFVITRAGGCAVGEEKSELFAVVHIIR